MLGEHSGTQSQSIRIMKMIKQPKFKIGDTVVLKRGLIKIFQMFEQYEVIGAFYCDWKYTDGIEDWRYVATKNRGRRHYTFWEKEIVDFEILNSLDI